MDQVSVAYNVLFLGNGNSARSIMAEAILNRDGHGKFNAFSAGIQAHEAYDPCALELMKKMDLAIPAYAPKSWQEFTGPDAPDFHFIFTLCESAVLLPRSLWNGNPVIANWQIANPALIDGNEAQRRLAYADVFRMISNRVGAFACLPVQKIKPGMMQQALAAIENQQETAIIAA